MSTDRPMFAEMFVAEDVDPRPDVPTAGDEKAMLTAALAWHRQTLLLKCSGLGPEALARRPVAFSGLSLLGLVRHLADVERRWFRLDLAGGPAEPYYRTDAHADAAFDDATPDPDVVAAAWHHWRTETAFADRFTAEAPSLEVSGTDTWRGTITLRWVLLHMIEEYARHNGHADLLRQGVDGAVGL